MNVAYHLQQLGVEATLISRVGHDERGRKLLEHLQEWGLSTAFCQVDPDHATSEVQVRMNENKDVSYDIVYPVAWDYIALQEALVPLLQHADTLIFGSLITRSEVSRQTLLELLKRSACNVFDVNLREPYYSPDMLAQLLPHAHLLKLNLAELELVTNWFGRNLTTEQDRINLLQDQFNIQEVIVTKGSRGASFYTPAQQYFQEAYPVQVADTIGSGDSFLAAFLAKSLSHAQPEVALAYAAALSAFVTMHHGACPPYSLPLLEEFKQLKEQQR